MFNEWSVWGGGGLCKQAVPLIDSFIEISKYPLTTIRVFYDSVSDVLRIKSHPLCTV